MTSLQAPPSRVPLFLSLLVAFHIAIVIASNYLVQPAVAWCGERPRFKPDPYEVALLLEVPLADLLDGANRREETWELRGHAVRVPYFSVQGQTVWGATAMMLGELLALPSLQALAGASDR